MNIIYCMNCGTPNQAAYGKKVEFCSKCNESFGSIAEEKKVKPIKKAKAIISSTPVRKNKTSSLIDRLKTKRLKKEEVAKEEATEEEWDDGETEEFETEEDTSHLERLASMEPFDFEWEGMEERGEKLGDIIKIEKTSNKKSPKGKRRPSKKRRK